MAAYARIPIHREIEDCRICADHLPHGPRPVVQMSGTARLLIIGQAPGRKVHETGIPWNDASGAQLRTWLDMSPDEFYDASRIAIMPMGFCYPGTGKSGDLPPRRECAPAWHARLLALMPHIRLTLLIGSYAQRHYLSLSKRSTLTETVAHYAEFLPQYFPLPHPSPRNRLWLTRNPWFEEQVVPALRQQVHAALAE
ncbi:uracil-DNA glycosylase [Paucimonas lemoignei]|uniref:Uracil-DNA glycosylase n=1 Tax=Paucimonas lemoignei TaxID=29443 RepID=A0A4R3HRI3_PAULE|nr:uracil-DNA glycosylase family protein [Paucimonas lemoignei]TCS35582.1 uracil-DNA glycosylase [Paucimonas lemoignei]